MKHSSDHTLEGLKLFPLFAWAILIMFAWFTYTLTVQLNSLATSLETTATINAAILENLSSTTPTLPK